MRLFIIDIPFYFYKYVVGKTFLYYNILPFDKLLLGDSWDSKTLKWLPTLTQKCSSPSSSSKLLGLKMTFFTTLHGAAVSGDHTLLQFHKKKVQLALKFSFRSLKYY